jgi:hypothetical protein
MGFSNSHVETRSLNIGISGSEVACNVSNLQRNKPNTYSDRLIRRPPHPANIALLKTSKANLELSLDVKRLIALRIPSMGGLRNDLRRVAEGDEG